MKHALALTALVPLLSAGIAQAGGHAEVAAPDGSARTVAIDWNDAGDVRVLSPGAPGYILEKDGTVYSVSKQGEDWLVVDMVKLNAARKAAGASTMQPLYKTITAISPLGQSETVAGITGHRYRVTWEENGKSTTETWVLTDNPAVVKMSHLFSEAMSAAYDYDGKAAENQAAFFDALPADEQGLLRSGATGQLTAFSSQSPDPQVFDLPAPPADIDKLMGGN
ncbi:MAG: hypothetical protein GC146_11990 [Limimaricola sp.]|uniref:hypothetical protein n=1 Tax=Limimaricola sp. TaxID=2211665 RepID=UPI001D28C7AB|nr:hypothetical protein [Limimaricola sp.]MBI1417935.1 hypothetical protein [Limimaricola sp.]